MEDAKEARTGGITSDNPIHTKEEDQLGRVPLAQTLAGEIRSLDASAGSVIGILGPWGSGKTSLVNLIRLELSADPKVPVLDFNPWMFSGTDELLQNFFIELSAQFRDESDRLARLADDVEAYGEILAPIRFLPVVGVWFERARSTATAIKKAMKKREGGVLAERDHLSRKLAELEDPIVVVVDDIDRLRTSEIRDIFKLVRLTANFPSIIYLLAFDRHRVEVALTEEGLIGRDYLEKILQIAYDIPAVPETVLTHRLTEALDLCIRTVDDVGSFDEAAWPDVLFEIIRPLVRNMRDVRRYVASLRGTLRSLEGQIALVDVLGLEAVRVFMPDAFRVLSRSQEALTSPGGFDSYGHESPHLKESINEFIEAAKDNSEIARAVIGRLFPFARRHIENMHYGPEFLRSFQREHRIGHPEFLKFYLERTMGAKLEAFTLAERAFASMVDEEALDRLLSSIEGPQLADVITSLEAYENEFPVEAVGPACVVLLNHTNRVPERNEGLFGMRADLIVTRVVLRLLRRLDGPDQVESVVKGILPRIELLSDRDRLITTVGYRENAGHKLLSSEAAAEMARELRAQVRAASPESLAKERDLLRLLAVTKQETEADEPQLPPLRDPALDEALLKAAVAETRSQSMESRAVSTKKRLHWDTLVDLVGGEDSIKDMIERLGPDASRDSELEEITALAHRYLEGWRPKDFD